MLYPNLIAAMKKEDVTKTDVANLLGIHFNTVTAKLEGESTTDKPLQVGFTFIEAVTIKRTFFKSYDLTWLFEFDSTEDKTA